MFDISKEQIKNHLNDFSFLYHEQNFTGNDGGMKFPQLFGMYCILKEIKPSLIIESGVWKGLGTWMIEKTLPESKIISFDIDLSNREYISDDVTYIENDISSIEWKEFFKDYPDESLENSLLFLDDHVDFSDRLNFLKDVRFKHIIDEDNYPSQQGNCISPKKILDDNECIIDKGGNKKSLKLDTKLKDEFNSIIKDYWEFPPIYLPLNTRWGDSFDNYNIKSPIFDTITDEIIEYDDFNNYTWICYMETVTND